MKKTIINRSTTSGAAMIETIFVFPVVMFLGFAILHLGLIYQAKSNLEYAALMAARMASTQGFYDVVNGVGRFDAFKEEVRCRMQASDSLDGANCNDPLELAKVGIKVIRPNIDTFEAWGDNCLGVNCAIANDNLLYRSPTDTESVMFPSGPEDINIQDANILQLEVTYKYDSGVPFLGRMFSDDPTATEVSSIGVDGQGVELTEALGYLSESERNAATNTPGMKLRAVSTVRMQTAARLVPGEEANFY